MARRKAPSRNFLSLLLCTGSLQESMSLKTTLGTHLPPDTGIITAASITDARDLLSDADRYFDAALLEWETSDGSGRELLPLLHARCKATGRQSPSVFMIVDTTNGASNDILRTLDRFPDLALVEKPYFAGDLASAILEALLPHTSDGHGYYGLRLIDLIQAYTLPRRSATLRLITRDGQIGLVSIREGQIVHAAIGGEQGIEALDLMMDIHDARIRLDKGCTTALRSIRISTEQALLHVARLSDERIRDTPQTEES